MLFKSARLQFYTLFLYPCSTQIFNIVYKRRWHNHGPLRLILIDNVLLWKRMRDIHCFIYCRPYQWSIDYCNFVFILGVRVYTFLSCRTCLAPAFTNFPGSSVCFCPLFHNILILPSQTCGRIRCFYSTDERLNTF